jgi:hypothetical protein
MKRATPCDATPLPFDAGVVGLHAGDAAAEARGILDIQDEHTATDAAGVEPRLSDPGLTVAASLRVSQPPCSVRDRGNRDCRGKARSADGDECRGMVGHGDAHLGGRHLLLKRNRWDEFHRKSAGSRRITVARRAIRAG